MERILRLSAANIKKHRKQTVLFAVLIMFCMAITASAAAGYYDIKGIFPHIMKEYSRHQSIMLINDDFYADYFIDVLREDERVTDAEHTTMLYSSMTKYIDKTGEERGLYMGFVTMDKHLQLESSPIETSLSDAEIAAIEHPLYMPYSGRESLRSEFKEGDRFDMIYSSKCFSFTVAGFYESIFLPETNNGFQFIVSDKDYFTLMTVIDNCDVLLFDCSPTNLCDDVEITFNNKISDRTGHRL